MQKHPFLHVLYKVNYNSDGEAIAEVIAITDDEAVAERHPLADTSRFDYHTFYWTDEKTKADNIASAG
jgi:hypothetical protein